MLEYSLVRPFPLFFASKLLAIARSILSKLRKPYTSPSLLFILSGDLSFFRVDFSLEIVLRT